jgi:hypothetical protein
MLGSGKTRAVRVLVTASWPRNRDPAVCCCCAAMTAFWPQVTRSLLPSPAAAVTGGQLSTSAAGRP